MKTKLLLPVFGLLISGSWALQQSGIQKAEWLLGTWETKTSKGNLYETWVKKSNTELQGKSYYLNKKDTILFESVRLIEKNKQLHYIVSVKNHNNNLPVDFTLKLIKEPYSLIFENPMHDFPQTIVYKKAGKDSLFAEISGMMNGKVARQSFPMKKIQ